MSTPDEPTANDHAWTPRAPDSVPPDSAPATAPPVTTPQTQRAPFPVVVPRSGLPVFAPVAAAQSVARAQPAAEMQWPATAWSAAPVASAPTPPKRSRTWVWVVILGIVAFACAGLAAYLWVINSQWQDQNDELRASLAEVSTQLDDTSTQVDELQSDLDDAQANLAGATGKVTDLADSSANAKDQAAFLTELADSYMQCSQAQANHIAHLENASRYTASSLAAEGRDVKQYCDDVEQTYQDFLASENSN